MGRFRKTSTSENQKTYNMKKPKTESCTIQKGGDQPFFCKSEMTTPTPHSVSSIVRSMLVFNIEFEDQRHPRHELALSHADIAKKTTKLNLRCAVHMTTPRKTKMNIKENEKKIENTDTLKATMGLQPKKQEN